MIFNVALQQDTILANVRAVWIAAGVLGAPFSAGITQPDVTLPIFRVSGAAPTDAEELIVYDNTDKPNNYNLGNYRLGALAAVTDPLSQTPDDYDEGTIGQLIGKLDVGEPTDPVVPVVAPDAPNQSVGQVVTRDARGAALAGVRIVFNLLTAPGADSYATTTITATSDGDGVLSVALRKGARYTAQRGRGGKIPFTVPTDEDAFALPQILGTP